MRQIRYPRPGLFRQCVPRIPNAAKLRPHTCTRIRNKGDVTGPPPNSAYPSITRWYRYEDPSEELNDLVKDRTGRNPLNYIEQERRRVRGNEAIKKRMYYCGFGLAACLIVQVTLLLTFGDEMVKKSSDQLHEQERLGARPPKESERSLVGADGVVVVGQKPGPDAVKLDDDGNELVETGSTAIPYVPKTIRLPFAQDEDATPTGSRSPTSPSASTLPSPTPVNDTEQYTLLGHGIRTVSFLSIKVYVLGVYVRTSDLPTLHAALVRSVSPSPSATSLLPDEKADLRKRLLDAEGSRKTWDKVLRESGVRMIVRVVPTRDTDFAHLRDGWVRGITARTQEASKAAQSRAKEQGTNTITTEYDDSSFGAAVNSFKALFGGQGSTPTGSEVMLMRDEQGALSVSYRRPPQVADKPEHRPRQQLGRIEDRRIGRLVWLGYLAGEKVSSEAARRNVVEGVMDLVERPVGTVGVGAA